MDYSLLHPRGYHSLPLSFPALAGQKGLELVIRPHVVCWDTLVALLGGRQVLLDRVIAQVDRAEKMGKNTSERKWVIGNGHVTY